MNKEFIPYEQASALKELWFDEKCLRVGNPHGHTMWKWIEVDGEPPTVNINDIIEVAYDEEWTQIPTFSQAFRWFREKYNLYAVIIPTITMYWTFKTMTVTMEVVEVPPYNHVEATDYSTYEEAELACLIKLIQIVKQEKKL